MATFGLVHGAYHGAWCWDRLTPKLEARGHRTLSVDLPNEDPDAGASEYAQVAIDAFDSAGDDLIVVGHSLGGLTIPVIAQMRPVRHLVFLCAMLPRPGSSHDDAGREEPDMGLPGPENAVFEGPAGESRWHPEAAASYFYADSSPEDAAWAVAQLRGQRWKITQEVTPLSAWPDTPATYVLGARDNVINPAWSRRMAPALLGSSPVEIDAGHSPFVSAPDALASALDEIAARADAAPPDAG
jgi:pimeloyl-ACP methyl ester carboxylesterase